MCRHLVIYTLTIFLANLINTGTILSQNITDPESEYQRIRTIAFDGDYPDNQEETNVDLKKTAVVLNGFLHDFAAGYWLSAMVVIHFLHDFQGKYPTVAGLLNVLEKFFFWNTIGAVVVILATGAGRTFTYVENWYGEDAEKVRRRMLIAKHVILFAFFGAGYLFVWHKVFH